MKRRLEIARGFLHHPQVLFLDEPTTGLDPQTRRRIWNHIQRINKAESLTILLTTHSMEEADALCGRVGIMDHGRPIALGTPSGLKDDLGMGLQSAFFLRPGGEQYLDYIAPGIVGMVLLFSSTVAWIPVIWGRYCFGEHECDGMPKASRMQGAECRERSETWNLEREQSPCMRTSVRP